MFVEQSLSISQSLEVSRGMDTRGRRKEKRGKRSGDELASTNQVPDKKWSERGKDGEDLD